MAIERPDAWENPLEYWFEQNLSYEALAKHPKLSKDDLVKFHDELARREALREAQLTDEELDEELNRLTKWGSHDDVTREEYQWDVVDSWIDEAKS